MIYLGIQANLKRLFKFLFLTCIDHEVCGEIFVIENDVLYKYYKQKVVYFLVYVIMIIVLVINRQKSFELVWLKIYHKFCVFVKSRKLCASLLLLEDYRRSLGVRFVQKYNNSENPSRSVKGLDVSLIEKWN